MNQSIIPAGYRISIKSWENDADYYQTIIHEGLSEDRVKFIVDLCKLFYSKNQTGGKTFGNLYEPSDVEVEAAAQAVLSCLTTHKSVLTDDEFKVVNTLLNFEDDIDDTVDEMVSLVSGFLGSSEVYAFRVFDTFNVVYVPTEVQHEDVTSRFK